MSGFGGHPQASQNVTANVSYTEFLLLAFPGFPESRYLLAIPFFGIYLTIMLANSMVIYVVKTEPRLHSPMYVLIALLLAANILGTTTILPKMLLSTIFGLSSISLTGCLVQMFFLYLAMMLDCGILLMMALDRYVAICHPLHYAEILTNKLLAILLTATLVRSMFIVSPVVILASRVRFCRSSIIGHFACEHMALMRLSCGDTSKNRIVGMAVRSLTIGFDVVFFTISYTQIIRTALKLSSGSVRHKAFHTCGSHLMVLFITYSSCLSSSIVFRVAKSASQDTHNLLSIMYLLFPWAINPVIYGVRTKEIRQSLLKIFHRKRMPFVPQQ
ncbi:olfactory receptor 52K1-like [Eublepharis macularius]|uniref:Olfactory receptor n=1 Tax=Eublepharis macularius TaxID=481883 RepID=A0AA97J3R9_EUBMA|nr:olfactory receptor 52K1-like [Eublepharis macularius]